MNNTNTAVAVVKNESVMPASVALKSAKAIKEKLALAYKGRELTAKVNEVLRGEKDLRGQLGVAWVQATIQSGFIPDVGDVRKNSAVLRFVKPVEAKAAAITKDEALAALGITMEQLNALASAKK